VDSENFIPSLRREARNGCIHLQTALTSTKDYIHIDDVVALLPRLAESGRKRIYNVATGTPITHAQWVERLRAVTACRIEVAADAPEVCFPVIDVRRLRAEFPHRLRKPLTALDT
jgi:nucleoside-diphosphate-sugar epimerase